MTTSERTWIDDLREELETNIEVMQEISQLPDGKIAEAEGYVGSRRTERIVEVALDNEVSARLVALQAQRRRERQLGR